MQKDTADLVQEMIDDGYTTKEINCFLCGLYEGMKTIQISMEGAKIEYSKEETDPLYVHTWNKVVDSIKIMLEKTIEEIFKEE